MYRLNSILNGLDGLVGWQQSHNLKKQIAWELVGSSSGLYFQDAHPLLTLENLRAIMPDDWIEGYPVAHSGEIFIDQSKWAYNGKVYRCICPEEGQIPYLPESEEGEAYWAEYDILSDYLADITRQGEVKVIQRFFQDKVNSHESKNLLENKSLFDGAGRLNDIVENKGWLVGFEFTPIRSQGITMFLNKIGLQMKGALGDVPLYLFHSSSEKPIATWVARFNNTEGSFSYLDFNPRDFQVSGNQAKMFDGELPYMKSTTDGGSFYLVYHQSELPEWMDAINYARDWSKAPCMACNRGNAQEWAEMTKYVRIMPFRVECDKFLQNHLLWPLEDMIYTPSTNYGINFRYTIGCDLTDFIIAQKDIFANAIQLQVAYTALKTMMNNPNVRVNREQVNSAALLYDLDGDSTGRASGMKVELENAYKALKIDTEGIAKVCLGCKRGGVTYGSM